MKSKEPPGDNDTSQSIELEGGKDMFNNSGGKWSLANMIYSGYMLKGAGLHATFGEGADAAAKGTGGGNG